MAKFKRLAYVLLSGMMASCTVTPKAKFTILDFSASDHPRIFGEGVVPIGFHIRDFTLSPLGNEFFFSVQHQRGYAFILGSKLKNGKWSLPEIASFSGNFTDFEPSFSPDGKRLYFASNRPNSVDDTKSDFDIWFVEKSADGWGAPVNLGAPVNTESNEFFPSISKSGNIYFTGVYKTGMGRDDIYMSQLINGKYEQPTLLDSAINSRNSEFNAFVGPNEDYIIFTAWGRPDEKGGGDLYISHRTNEGKWLPAKNMGDKINSPYLDYCPFVDPTNANLFFTSNRFNSDHFLNKSLTWEEFKKLLSSSANGNGSLYIINYSSATEIK